MNPWKTLERPVVTEKSTLMGESGKYVFRVHRRATKDDIRVAIEAAFDVTVTGVNTLKVPGKVKTYRGRPHKGPSWKKAIVTLQPGDTIQLFEGA